MASTASPRADRPVGNGLTTSISAVTAAQCRVALCTRAGRRARPTRRATPCRWAARPQLARRGVLEGAAQTRPRLGGFVGYSSAKAGSGSRNRSSGGHIVARAGRPPITQPSLTGAGFRRRSSATATVALDQTKGATTPASGCKRRRRQLLVGEPGCRPSAASRRRGVGRVVRSAADLDEVDGALSVCDFTGSGGQVLTGP
jgi:hypothetical protein